MFDEVILNPSETREDSVTMDTNTHQSSVSSCVPLVWMCSLLDQRLDFLQVSVQSCRPDTCTRAHTHTQTHAQTPQGEGEGLRWRWEINYNITSVEVYQTSFEVHFIERLVDR